MFIEQALFQMLSNDAGIVEIVGEKIYPVTVPPRIAAEEETAPSYPALVYALLTRQRQDTHDGPVGMVESHFELACLSTNYFEAKRLANRTRLALHGNAEVLQSYFDDEVNGIYFDDERDDYLFDEVEHLSLFYIPQHFVIQYREPLILEES